MRRYFLAILVLFAAAFAVAGGFLKGVRSAKVSLETFGNDGGEYGPKDVWCNGFVVGQLPDKELPDGWEKVEIDVPTDKLRILQTRNVLRVTQPANDCFKIRNVALKIQRGDGRWLTTSVDTNVYCSKSNWSFAEGTPFVDDRYSPEIGVVLE